MKPNPCFLTGLLLAYSVCYGCGLRLRQSVIPPYKLRGDTVELRCDYEEQNSTIYSVKWFKDDEEFFRYVPLDKPPYQYYTRVGVSVDVESSAPSKVVLRGVGFNTSGQYRCDVSAEGPDFNTVTGAGSLLVIEPPRSGPVISGGRERYRVNDTVDLVCTSAPSRPSTHLTWRINGRHAPKELVTKERPYMTQDGLLTEVSRLVFVARPFHFQRGMLQVKCIAEMSRQRLMHHTRIPDTFRPREGFFQASGSEALMTSLLPNVTSLLTILFSVFFTIAER